jgi:hypothetical protein
MNQVSRSEYIGQSLVRLPACDDLQLPPESG